VRMLRRYGSDGGPPVWTSRRGTAGIGATHSERRPAPEPEMSAMTRDRPVLFTESTLASCDNGEDGKPRLADERTGRRFSTASARRSGRSTAATPSTGRGRCEVGNGQWRAAPHTFLCKGDAQDFSCGAGGEVRPPAQILASRSAGHVYGPRMTGPQRITGGRGSLRPPVRRSPEGNRTRGGSRRGSPWPVGSRHQARGKGRLRGRG